MIYFLQMINMIIYQKKILQKIFLVSYIKKSKIKIIIYHQLLIKYLKKKAKYNLFIKK